MRHMDGCMDDTDWMDGTMDELTNGWMGRCIDGTKGIGGCMDEITSMNAWMEEQKWTACMHGTKWRSLIRWMIYSLDGWM